MTAQTPGTQLSSERTEASLLSNSQEKSEFFRKFPIPGPRVGKWVVRHLPSEPSLGQCLDADSLAADLLCKASISLRSRAQSGMGALVVVIQLTMHCNSWDY